MREANEEPMDYNEVFLETTVSHGLRHRMHAARNLAHSQGAEKWLVVLLADPASMHYRASTSHNSVEGDITDSDRAVIGELLKHLPSRASAPVLWATTNWLAVDLSGLYPTSSEVIPGIYGAMETSGTGPLKELARATLKRALGVDHGYDKIKWRHAILKRRGSKEAVDSGGTNSG
jgi:hypothetical protein